MNELSESELNFLQDTKAQVDKMYPHVYKNSMVQTKFTYKERFTVIHRIMVFHEPAMVNPNFIFKSKG